MPLPFIVGGIAAIAGAAGIGAGVHGAVKMKDAKDTMRWAEEMVEESTSKYRKHQDVTASTMDSVGKKELAILDSFNEFSDVFEQIKGRPEFKAYKNNGVEIPKMSSEEIKEVSVGAAVLLGGLGGAALGTAGGFAAAGATTAAVMALGTASTGTAISTLSGAALTNATLAALGGGAIGSSTFAGGMALGSTVLGAATLGVGLLVGGVIFGVTGGKLSDKADEAYSQAYDIKCEVTSICEYLESLDKEATRFLKSLNRVEKVYIEHLNKLKEIVLKTKKTEWGEFTDEEKLITENTTYLVQLLFTMCKTKLVLQDKTKDEINKVNSKEIKQRVTEADKLLEGIK